MIRDAGPADGAEIDRFEAGKALEPILIHHAAGPQVMLAPPGKGLEREGEPAIGAGRQPVEDADPLRDDFLTDAVARNHGDATGSRGHGEMTFP